MRDLRPNERNKLKNDIISFHQKQTKYGVLNTHELYYLYYDMRNISDNKLINKWKNCFSEQIIKRGYNVDTELEKRIKERV